MYIHLNPQRTQAFSSYNHNGKGLTIVWVDWPLVDSASLVIWPDITSYNLEVRNLIEVFGPDAEGLPHELTSIYP